ncbi:MAG: ATP-binding protein [Candidatus Hydrogenedentota bacterium]
MKIRNILEQIKKHNREVWGFSLFIPLFLSVFALFVILAAVTGDIKLFHIIFFVIASSIFWLIDPWIKTVIPRNVATLLLISIYLILSQFLIAYTGGVNSQFFFVYYIVIFTGAINYGLSGSLGVTMLLFFAYLSFADTNNSAELQTVTSRWIILFILSLMIGFLSEHKKRTEGAIFQRVSKMSTLNEISKLLKATLEKNRILSLILDITMSILNAQYGGIYIYDEKEKGYQPFIEHNPSKFTLYELLHKEGDISIIDWAEANRRPMIIKRFDRYEKFYDHKKAKKIIRSLMSVLLDIEEMRIVLIVANKSGADLFTDDDFELFNIIINEIEITLENAKLHSQVLEMKNYRDLLMNSISYCLIAIDENGIIQTVNPSAASLLGFHEHEILGENLYKLLAIDKKSIFDSFKENIIFSKEVYFKNNKKKLIPVQLSVSTLRAEGKYKNGWIFVFRDISKQKEIEEELENKRILATLGEMAAGVAHEIRNPLGGIEGFAALLERDLKDDPTKANLARKISEGAHSLNKIVKQLLLFTSRSQPVKIEVPLNSLVDNSITYIEDEITAKGIKLKKNYKIDEHFKIAVDPERIRQVIQNLVLNSVEALEEGGTIVITTEHNSSDNQVIVSVKDNGPGIADDIVDKIWDPFFTTKPKGLGLGLSITKKIIEEHNGKLWYERAKPQGAIFNITLYTTG